MRILKERYDVKGIDLTRSEARDIQQIGYQ
jgi:hypothetical protein